MNDKTAPSLEILAPTNYQEVGKIFEISGKVADNESGVKAVYIKTDNGAFKPGQVSLKHWNIPITNLSLGYHTNYIYAEDQAGNKSPVLSVIILRSYIPSVSIKSPPYGYSTQYSNITISGVAEMELPYSLTKVQIQVNGGIWYNTDGTTVWSKEFILTNGTNSFIARAIGSNNRTNETSPYLIFYQYPEKLYPSDATVNADFGGSLAISADGDTIVVGASSSYGIIAGSGAAYVYHWNGSAWETDKLFAMDGATNFKFGCSVAVSSNGETIIVGSYRNSNQCSTCGAVYLFHWSGTEWETNKFIPADGEVYDQFGYSVALSADGNKIAVGAYGDDDNGSSSGSVYLFKWNATGWLTNKIVPSDGGANYEFGFSVALSADGNTLAVGTPHDCDPIALAGSVYRFYWNGFVWLTNKFLVADAGVLDRFGYSVAVSADGNTIVSSVYKKNKVYRLCWNGAGWESVELSPLDAVNEDYFGYKVSVSADGNTIVGSSFYNDGIATNSGAVYAFHWNGSFWLTNKFTPLDGASDDYFGASVAISADGIKIAGAAMGDDDMGAETGSLYIYTQYAW
ncbi:MAG: hypothetical protein HPY53_13470 [Brevinematales bacterium]|nr:hypothetical protein [Brevinematales bacterium]